MSMLNDKNVVDKYFKDNWTTTPISYDGVPFKEPYDKLWIAPSLAVYDREAVGFGGDVRKKDLGLINVRVYGNTSTVCMKLANEVQDFLECKNIATDDNGELRIDMGIPDSLGATNMGNNTYELMLSFKTIKYN